MLDSSNYHRRRTGGTYLTDLIFPRLVGWDVARHNTCITVIICYTPVTQ